MRELVCFFVHGRELGVPIEDVRETIALRSITRVFRTTPTLAGITSVRGEILAVLDLGALLGLSPSARADENRIVIVRRGAREAGLLVDLLAPLRQVPDELIGPVPPTLSARAASVLSGIASLDERPLGILDVERIFDSPDLAPHVASTSSREHVRAKGV